MANKCPIVLVHGLFGYGPKEMLGFDYWGQGTDVDCPLPLYEASVGPMSSSHDRACELFAQIKGTQVKYGEDHSKEADHKSLGKDFTGNGFHKDWSAENPIHLVGHSLGGPTVRMLQYLLHKEFWGKGTNENWIKSITGISPAFNGSTFTYMVGCSEDNGKVTAPIGKFLGLMLKAFAGFTDSQFESIYDFDLAQWNIPPRKDTESIRDFIDRIERSQLFEGTDNAAYGLTLQCLLKQNQEIATFPNTYYFSYVTEQTSRAPGLGYYFPDPFRMNGFLLSSAFYMGKKRFSKPFYPGFKDEDWWQNDGAVSSYSQMYPRISGNHLVGGEFSDETDAFEPRKWYWQYLHDRDHLDVVMLPEPWQIEWQRTFYTR